jgi:hypothetical protein
MAARRNYYFKQLVTDEELDAGFEALEEAVWAVPLDFGMVGVAANAAVTEKAGTPDLTVDVSAGGLVYDQLGRRINNVALQNVNVAVDSSGASTSVAGGGNEKWVSVSIRYKKALSDPRIDGNSNTVFFVEDESFEFVVLQGAEAAIGAATRPGLLSDAILLADVQRLNGQTQILNANISSALGSGYALGGDTRRQDAFVLSAGTLDVREGTPGEMGQALLDILDDHTSAGADVHDADQITNTPAGSIVATNVQDAIDELDTEKGGLAAGNTWTNRNTYDEVIDFGAAGIIRVKYVILTNANATIGPTAANDMGAHEYRVPTITADRVLTFGATNPTDAKECRIRVVRLGTAAFKVTVEQNGGTDIAEINAGAAGMLEFTWRNNGWRLSAWSGGVTILSTLDT